MALWRCWRCKKMLGRYAEGRVVIIHGGRVQSVRGDVESTCPNCGAMNKTTSDGDAPTTPEKPLLTNASCIAYDSATVERLCTARVGIHSDPQQNPVG